MKRLFILLTAGCFLYPIINYGSETAHARLYCMSLQFGQATAYSSYDGFYWQLNLTTLPPGINGELALQFLAGSYTNFTHSAYVELYSELYGETDSGAIGLNVPSGDANGDGYPDFFEVSQPVNNLTSSGVLWSQTFYYYGDAFQATWNRAAGSSTGTCSFQVDDPDDLGYYYLQFNFTFTLIEYTGPLTYTPGTNIVSAAVNLVQTGNSSSTLQGPISFIKSSTDPFNTLTNQPGVWTNAASQTLNFYSEIFSRNTPWPTNYIGYMYFADGDPSTTSPDYQLWVLSIDDTNDANGNGIPDFSDNPSAVAPPRAPQLSLTFGSTNLLLTINGDVGHTNQVQEIGSLASTNWQTMLSFVQTNDPQVVSLPLPANTPKFWRVVAW